MAFPAPLDPDEQDRLDAFDNVVGPMSIDEYLAFDEASERRHEYVEGVVYAMSGGTAGHHRVALAVAAWLRDRSRGTGCESFMQGPRTRTPRDSFYYPDVMVRCGPRLSDRAQYVTDPCLAVEVLSPSTSRYDFGDKRDGYLGIASLRAYLVIETAWRCVHRYWRDDAGAWQRDLYVGADAVVPLPCPPGAALPLPTIYEDVEVGDTPPRPRRVREAIGAALPADDGA